MPENDPKTWFELVWSVDRDTESEFDLQEFAYDVLEQAKENLREDGSLASAAWVIDRKSIHCFHIGCGRDEKYDIYAKLVATARELRAEAIVTLNDAYWGEKYDPATYYQGKLAEEGRECIYVTVTAPNSASWSLDAKYERLRGKIVFQPTERSEGDKIALLGSWSKEMKEVQ